MHLDEWTSLSDQERRNLQQKWHTLNPYDSRELRSLTEQALQQFRLKYASHPLISRIDSTVNFNPLSCPSIIVYIYLWKPDIILDLPSKFVTFPVEQYTETIRFHLVQRFDQYSIYDALHEEDGALVHISQEPFFLCADTPDILHQMVNQYSRAFKETVLKYDEVLKCEYGYTSSK